MSVAHFTSLLQPLGASFLLFCFGSFSRSPHHQGFSIPPGRPIILRQISRYALARYMHICQLITPRLVTPLYSSKSVPTVAPMRPGRPQTNATKRPLFIEVYNNESRTNPISRRHAPSHHALGHAMFPGVGRCAHRKSRSIRVTTQPAGMRRAQPRRKSLHARAQP